jgi:hypothetical protein
MTPKEKAQELVDNFLENIKCADRYNYNLESKNDLIAKQCALIAVDELISYSSEWDDSDYWQQVKTEIESI